MHTQPMSESEGLFNSEYKKCKGKCPKCGLEELEVKEWESSCGGYTDYKYRCRNCSHKFWVDGIDS